MSDSKKPTTVEIHEGEEKLVLDHDYDGIHELNHVLPRWWLWILYATIVFAVFYSFYYLSGMGPSSQQELTAAMKKIDALRPAPTMPSNDQEDALLAAYKDPAKVKHGAEVFTGKCFMCHGDKAQGNIGPNLTDDSWLHGKGNLKDIAAVIANGVLDKGMPSWATLLTADELRDVTAFVRSVHGSKPDGAKAPQGEVQESKD